MEQIEKIHKTELKIGELTNQLTDELKEFVLSKGGFIRFNINERDRYPECPIVRVIDIAPIMSRRRTEPAYEHIVYALKADKDDLLFYSRPFHDSFTELVDDDDLNDTESDDWHSLYSSEDVLFFDTIDRIICFIECYMNE